MPTLSTPTRPSSRRGNDEERVRLHHRTLGEAASDVGEHVPPPVLNWLVGAVGGGFAAALAGWVVVVGIVVLGWLSGSVGPLTAAVRLGTQLWLLAHGAGAQIGGTRWTLIPLGVTVVFAVCISQIAGFTARQARAGRLLRADADQLDRAAQAQIVRRVVWMVSVVYVGTVTVVALAVGEPGQAVRGFVVSAAIAVVSTTWGACRGLSFRPTESWPVWLQAVPRAVAGSLSVVLVGACVAVIITLGQHTDQVTTIGASVGAVGLAGVVLVLLQLAYWPNLLVWAASWILGAGFGLGAGSLVSPRDSHLGLLPAIPVFGALPAEGPGSRALLAWLAVGVVAGVVGASIVVRHRRGRFDETCLVGGLSGALSGLVLVGVAAISRGDLGTGRLVGLGPRLVELAVMGVTLMGLAGMATGLVWGLVTVRSVKVPRQPPETGSEHTIVLEPDFEVTRILSRDDS